MSNATTIVAKITEKLIDLGIDELRVVEIIVDRLASGQVTYILKPECCRL